MPQSSGKDLDVLKAWRCLDPKPMLEFIHFLKVTLWEKSPVSSFIVPSVPFYLWYPQYPVGQTGPEFNSAVHTEKLVNEHERVETSKWWT